MSSIIYTVKERCRGCYACVRGCPTKAIKVENRLAEVMPDLCVNCGNCVRVCAPKAKVIESDIEVVKNLLASGSQVIAIPSSSFPGLDNDTEESGPSMDVPVDRPMTTGSSCS